VLSKELQAVDNRYIIESVNRFSRHFVLKAFTAVGNKEGRGRLHMLSTLCKPKARTSRQRDKMSRSHSEIMAAASLLDFSVQETMLSVDAAYGEDAFIASDWDIYYDDDVEVCAVAGGATPHDVSAGDYQITDGFHIIQAAAAPQPTVVAADNVKQTKMRSTLPTEMPAEYTMIAATPSLSTTIYDQDNLKDTSIDPLKANCRKLHVCLYDGCNKYYGKSSHLKAHMRAHTG